MSWELKPEIALSMLKGQNIKRDIVKKVETDEKKEEKDKEE